MADAHGVELNIRVTRGIMGTRVSRDDQKGKAVYGPPDGAGAICLTYEPGGQPSWRPVRIRRVLTVDALIRRLKGSTAAKWGLVLPRRGC